MPFFFNYCYILYINMAKAKAKATSCKDDYIRSLNDKKHRCIQKRDEQICASMNKEYNSVSGKCRKPCGTAQRRTAKGCRSMRSRSTRKRDLKFNMAGEQINAKGQVVDAVGRVIGKNGRVMAKQPMHIRYGEDGEMI